MASFLDMFSALDSDGAKASRYRLAYEGSVWSNQDSWFWGMATSLVYTAFKWIAVIANGLLGFVMSSASWSEPLADWYRKLTGPLYDVIPPWTIALFGIAIIVYRAWRSKSAGTRAGLLESSTLNKIGSALAMCAVVVILTHNPFALMNSVLELANGFAVGLSSTVTGSVNTTTISAGQALVDNSVRTPTIALTYGKEFSAACRTAWSQAMTSGTDLTPASGCFTEGENKAGPDTVITGVFMLIFPAVPMLVFSVIAAWKYIKHLSLSVWYTVSAAWIAAVAVSQPRGFDKLSDHFSKALGHLAMVVITSMVAVALPTTVSGFATQLLGVATNVIGLGEELQPFVMMLTLGIGFMVSAWVIYRVTANHGVLVRILRANTSKTINMTLGDSPTKSLSSIPGQLKGDWKGWDTAKALFAAQPGKNADDEEAEKASRGGGNTGDEASTNTKKKGEGDSVNVPSAEDAAAVEEMTKASATVAEATADPHQEPSLAPVVATVGHSEEGANRQWSQPQTLPLVGTSEPQRSTTTSTTVKDTQGFYTVPDAPQNQDEEDIIDVEYVEVLPESRGLAAAPAASTASAPIDSSPIEAAGTESSTASTGSPVITQPSPLLRTTSEEVTANPSQPQSATAQAEDVLIAPVAGNLEANPALNAAAVAVGGTLDGDRPAAAPPRTYTEGMRFNTDAPSEAPQFSGAPIAEGTPVTVSAADGSPQLREVPETVNGGGGIAAENLTDQQKWNRRERGGPYFIGEEDSSGENDVTSSSSEELPPSGIGPGSNPNPSSYHGPNEDFLATDMVQVGAERVATESAAAGKPVRTEYSTLDNRVEARITSDPDKRVTSNSDRPGFGEIR